MMAAIIFPLSVALMMPGLDVAGPLLSSNHLPPHATRRATPLSMREPSSAGSSDAGGDSSSEGGGADPFELDMSVLRKRMEKLSDEHTVRLLVLDAMVPGQATHTRAHLSAALRPSRPTCHDPHCACGPNHQPTLGIPSPSSVSQSSSATRSAVSSTSTLPRP